MSEELKPWPSGMTVYKCDSRSSFSGGLDLQELRVTASGPKTLSIMAVPGRGEMKSWPHRYTHEQAANIYSTTKKAAIERYIEHSRTRITDYESMVAGSKANILAAEKLLASLNQ